MESLKATWADAIRLANKLPTTDNLASYAGGITVASPRVNAMRALDLEEKARVAGTGEIARTAESQVPSLMSHATTGDFGRVMGSNKNNLILKPTTANRGGMVPDITDQDVLTLLRNAIGQDRLGFGK
jgi:hypothetical protein